MASELRWILAAIGVPLLIAIWWWSARRSRQAPGDPQLRESALTPDLENIDETARQHASRDATGSFGNPRDRRVSPLEPLSIRTADFDGGEVEDLPMSAYPPDESELEVAPPVMSARHADGKNAGASSAAAIEVAAHDAADVDGADFDAADFDGAATSADAAAAGATAVTTNAAAAPFAATAATHGAVPRAAPEPAALPGAASDASPPAPMGAADASATGANRQAPNASELQRIVGVRVCAAGAVSWNGAALLATLEGHGMAFGRYQVFHRRHADGRSLFFAASLVEPGTFDLSTMPRQQFVGLTLFAVLPGPAEPLQTFDALIRTAVGLAQELHGTVQDSTGALLSPERLEEMREDVANFQTLLHVD